VTLGGPAQINLPVKFRTGPALTAYANRTVLSSPR